MGMRRIFDLIVMIAMIALSISCPVTTSVLAADFPTKAITIINPMSPGGSRDVTARAFAAAGEKLLGQPLVVVNKAGAGGMIGMVAGAQAAPDGYTLTVTSSGDTCSLLWEVANDRKPPFALTDFAPIGSWLLTSSLVVVPYNSPWKTLSDLVRDCKAKPSHYAYASGGMYGITHISAEILLKAAGIKARNVPYKGGGPSLTAVVGGHVDFSLQYPPTSIPLAQGNKLRILAILAEKRIKSIPDVPTVKEALGVEAESYQMVGLLAPRKTPGPVLQKLRETFAKVVKDKTFVDAVTGMGEEVYTMNADELAKYLERESEKISAIMADLAKEAKETPKK
jgi:tripartite-type tricarboxylate transporter receptor subunit TctC